MLATKTRRLAASLSLVGVGAYALLMFLARVTLVVDGQKHVRHTFHKKTVRDLLDSFQVKLSSQDMVQPGLEDKLRWGEEVHVIRVLRTQERKTENVDFILDWKRRTSKNLRAVEIQNGVRKKTTWTVTRIYHDGEVAEENISKKRTTKTPVTRLVLLTKSGAEEKVYDLSKAKKMQVVATAYWKGDPQSPSDETYLGYKVERGLVAVDPKVIPLGMRLYVPGYGYAYSSDTGSAIKGKHIDLFVESKKASYSWEYRKTAVYILEKAPDW